MGLRAGGRRHRADSCGRRCVSSYRRWPDPPTSTCAMPSASVPARASTSAKVDPSATHGHTKEAAADELAGGPRPADRSPGPALGRGQAQGPRRPPGDRRRRQGRHDPPRDGRVQPAGLPGDVVQGPVGRGARPRLPLARPPRVPGNGEIGDLQPLSLRGRPRRPGPRPRPEGRLVAPLRPDQRVRAAARRRRARRSSSSSCTSTGTSSASGSRPGSTIRRSAGSSASAISRSASAGTTTSPRTRTSSRAARPTTRPGT